MKWVHFTSFPNRLFIFLFLITLSQSTLYATTWEVNAATTSASTSGSSYDNDQDISTTLTLAGASYIRVTVSGELESGYDFLYITANSEMKTYSGVLNSTYVIQGNTVSLRFTSDHSVTKAGPTVTITTATADELTTDFNYGVLPFDLINPLNTQNIIGNTQIIGNTVECVTTTEYASSANYANGYSDLDCDNTIGNYNNNNYTIKYIDIDENTSTFNSSSATIKLPTTYKEIAWVGLFWQAHINNNSVIYRTRSGRNYNYTYSNDYPAGGIEDTTSNNVLLKIGDDEYTTIQADTLNYFNSTSYARYSAFANITKYFTETYSPSTNVKITVANILSTVGIESGLGNYGAWSLVVIYKEDEDNSLSKLRNNSVYLGYKSISNNNPDTITLNDFLLPKSGDIDSQMAVFAAEGEYRYKPDAMTLDGIALGDPDKDNVFDARLSPNITRNPTMTNNNGIDIDVFDTSSIMTTKRDADLTATSYSSTISLTSSSDLYYPSMVSFTTELYKPRVCYYIDTIVDGSGAAIFEDGAFTGEINSGENYTYNLWISNMRESSSDTFVEVANLVQVYLEMNDNFNYITESTSIQNVNETTFTAMSDAISSMTNDLGDYNSSSNTSTWRVGIDATNTQGGTLIPNISFPPKAYVSLDASITTDENTTTINLLDYLSFKASFQTDTITIGADNAQVITQCNELDLTGSIGGILGAFNVVNENGGVSSFDDPSNPETYLVTQVANKPFNIKIISLNSSGDALQAYNGDVNVSLIQTPDYASCVGNEICLANLCDTSTSITTPVVVNFPSTSSTMLNNYTYQLANQNVSFKVSYNNGTQHACSLDSFAIRPDKFILSSTDDLGILTSAQDYNLTLNAIEYTTSPGTEVPVTDYTVATANAVLDINQTLYHGDGITPDTTNELNGDLVLSTTPFSITNGTALNAVGVSFDDVGLVNIQLVDTNWSSVDIANGDTPADCTATGAYICGNINATFIPDHFALTTVELHDAEDSDFTYFSNDLNQSAKISLTITANNADNNPTINFRTNEWENPVDINFTVAQANGNNANKTEIDDTTNLGFGMGVKSIAWDETNSSLQLNFNYPRDINLAQNPVRIDGATQVTVQATSNYVGATTNKDVIGTNAASQNATFVYGRTHAPRQRFIGNTGNALIYYESYCNLATGCDKTLLPDLGANAKYSDDPRWFINTSNTSTATGNIGTISQRNGTGNVTLNGALTAGIGVTTAPLIYGTAGAPAPLGYPYKASMENNASTWLIYHPFTAGVSTNEFEVEFDSANSSWAGVHETNTSTGSNAAPKTNRRSMW